MTTLPFDIKEANDLAREYGQMTGTRVEYRFCPDEPYSDGRSKDEFVVRFYAPDGRNHGVRFAWGASGLAQVFAEAKDAWEDWSEHHPSRALL